MPCAECDEPLRLQPAAAKAMTGRHQFWPSRTDRHPAVRQSAPRPLPVDEMQVAIGTRLVYTRANVLATPVGATHDRRAGPPPQPPPGPSQYALAGAP